jgi:N-methylhydantoinase A/oxoprolinase/acetone carboxylase beta subunit
LVVLGLLLPNNFLGGRKSLDLALATTAIEKHVSEPLKVDAETGAQAVLDCATKMMSTLVEETAHEVGWRHLAGVELFAYGGNGPLFGTLIADLLGIKKVRLFALGTVFSAFGSAISDVLHVYEQAISSDYFEDLIGIGDRLAVQAHNDLRGEGFDPEKAILSWTGLDKTGTHTQVDGDIKQALPEILENIEKIAVLRLEARYSVGRVSLPTFQGTGREEWEDHSVNKIPVIQHENTYGKKIDGPCLVDGGNFTWFVSHDWSLVVDNKGDAIAERSPSE